MSNFLIVIADEDENYLMPLELKFVEELENKADIVIITDRDYLREFFSAPKKIDILIINKSLYSDAFNKHDIENIFILTEDEAENDNEIYKYTSVKDIFDFVMGNVKTDTENLISGKNRTKTILVYSPVGGSGKTTLSVAISGIISKRKKKVLFISTENIQSFGYLISCSTYMSKSFVRSLLNEDSDIVDKLKDCVEVSGFHYLPPIKQAIAVLGITLEKYINLIEKLKEANIYDYIVIDSTSILDQKTCMLMSIADKVVIVANQDRIAVKKIDMMLDNIDCSDSNKFVFICNKYNKSMENHLMNSTMKNSCIVKQYIDCLEEKMFGLDKVMENEKLINFVYSII